MTTDVQASGKFKHFGHLKTELEAKKSQSDKNKNLYDHLSKVLDHIILHCPNNALNKVEEISYLLKHNDKISIEKFLLTNKQSLYSRPGDSTTKRATEQFVKDAKLFFEVSHFWLFEFLLETKRDS